MFKIFIVIIILLAIVHSCVGDMNISKRAQKYLTKEYGGSFSVIDSERVWEGSGPIPVFFTSYHWEFIAVSDQFPDRTFKVYYYQDDRRWLDDYFSVLFQDEVITKTVDCAKQFFHVDCVAQVVWNSLTWPEGIDKNCSLAEWFQAGGDIFKIHICLKNYQSSDSAYRDFAEKFASEIPCAPLLVFTVLTDEGFEALSNNKTNIDEFLGQNPEFRIDRRNYDCSANEFY